MRRPVRSQLAPGLFASRGFEDDDIARPQRRHEELFDVSEERGILDPAIEEGGAVSPSTRNPCNQWGLPMTAGRVIPQPHTAGSAP